MNRLLAILALVVASSLTVAACKKASQEAAPAMEEMPMPTEATAPAEEAPAPEAPVENAGTTN